MSTESSDCWGNASQGGGSEEGLLLVFSMVPYVH